MKKPLAALVAATGIVAVAACSGGGGGGGGESPNPGHGTGTLLVIASAEAICLNDTAALSTCQTQLVVLVNDSNDAPVNDAKVTFGPPTNLAVMTNGSGGQYLTVQTSFGLSYHLSVQRGSDSLTGVVIASPHDFAMKLTPDPPTAGQPAKLTYTPSGASGVSSLVDVFELPSGTQTYQDNGIHSDDGKRDFTSSVFPQPGSYQIQMGLATDELLQGGRPGSSGLAIIGRVKNVTVP